MQRRSLFAALAVGATLFAACADDATAPEGDEAIGSIVEAGKADDFFALTAQEYYVEGEMLVELDGSWLDRTADERLAEVKRLIPYKQVVVGWFLNVYLVDKDSSGDAETYGGFKALTKNGSYEDLEITEHDELRYAFRFRQEVGGQLDLIRALPDAVGNVDGSWTFPLVIGKISNTEMQRLDTDREWYRSSPWGSFNPANVDPARLETLELTIRPEPASSDAWLETERLFEDDRLTVGIHFGWDYHNAYHEVHSKQVYEWLVRKGLRSPVASWDDLSHDAGPLTGTITYRGRTIAVEVSIFWGRKGDATDPDTAAGGRQLEADMLESLASREVVIFNGHSGPFYGFALANWKVTSEGDLDDSELAAVELMTGHYQLVVAEGCDTYALGEAFYMNPYKDGLEDIDVITTTSFSNASTSAAVTDVLTRLIGPTSRDTVEPSLFSDLLADLDRNSRWFSTMYGVHGIDDNPTVHPWADPALTCAACARQSDCGAGMHCVRMGDGERACAAECTASTGCGDGATCRQVQLNGYLTRSVCAPESLSCAAPAPDPVVVLVNEVMPNPDSDTNGDGAASSTQDEFVELVNASAIEVDLAGWSLSDAVGVRHVFPTGTVLSPGGALVVFGGGAPAIVPGTSLVQTASTGRLGLNNDGDVVRLADLDGQTVSATRYASGTPRGVSLNRVDDGRDGDADAWHTAAPTPGTRQDGSHF